MQDLHARLQPFLLFFIDGASFIDEDDPKWEVVLATEQHAGQEVVVRNSANVIVHWSSHEEHLKLIAHAYVTQAYLWRGQFLS